MATACPPPARWKLRLLRHPFVDWGHFSTWCLLFGCRLENRPDLPTGVPVIFAGNHASHFDMFFMHECLSRKLNRQVRTVAWGEMGHMPGLRLLMYGFEAILVSKRKEAVSLRQMIQVLRSGTNLAVLCEGQRNEVLGTFHPGAAIASLMTGCAIVPFSLRGAQPVFKELPWPNRLWGHVSVRFHPLLYPQPYLEKYPVLRTAAEQMTADLRAIVASGIDYPVS